MPIPMSRRRFLNLAGTATVGNLFSRTAGAHAEVPAADALKTAKDLATAINGFAIDLHRQLAKAEKEALFFSPFSINTALSMTAAGAKGTTHEEMQKVLHLPAEPNEGFGALLKHLNGSGSDKKRGYELTVANALWAQKGFPWRKEFMSLTQKFYGTGIVETDFGKPEIARGIINNWV